MTATRPSANHRVTAAVCGRRAGSGLAPLRMLALLCCLVPGLGCQLAYPECSGPIADALRTVIREPVHFPREKNDFVLRMRNRCLADQAWGEVVLGNPAFCASPDYAYGFVEGFADYLYAGGSGQPPPVPPREYWKASYETPAGRAAIEQWFAGFQHGVAVCQARGYRSLAVLPASVSLPSSTATTDNQWPAEPLAPVSGGEPSQNEHVEPIVPMPLELPLPQAKTGRQPTATAHVHFQSPGQKTAS